MWSGRDSPGWFAGRRGRGFATRGLRLASLVRAASAPSSRMSAIVAPGCGNGVQRVNRGCIRHRNRGGESQRHGPSDRLAFHSDPNDLSDRHARPRRDLRRDELRLLSRHVEESRQHVGAVLGGEDPRHLRNARDANLPLPESFEHLGEPLDQRDRLRAVERVPTREPELPDEELEQARIPELFPASPAIEVGQLRDEVGHRATLVPEQGGEAGDQLMRRRYCRHARRAARGSDNYIAGQSADRKALPFVIAAATARPSSKTKS